MEKILLTPTEAAKITGISENTIRQMCDNDTDFPSFKIGTYNKIGRVALEEWVYRKCQEKAIVATEYRNLIELSKRDTTRIKESKRYNAK